MGLINMTQHTLNVEILEPLIIFISALVASSGFWLYVMKKTEGKDLIRRLVLGLAHDRLMFLSMLYIDKGRISKDEYENLCMFLYEPYKELLGNGTISRLMTEVDKLPITQEPTKSILKENKNA